MKTLFVFLFSLLLFAAPAMAQGGSPQSTNAIQHFSVSATAVPWAGTQTSPGVVEGGSVGLTQRVSLGFQHISLAPATYDIGLAEYTAPVKVLLGKKISAKLTFDPSKYSVTFFAGAGLIRQTAPDGTQLQEVSETAGAGLNYCADSHVCVEIISGQWLHHGGSNIFLITPDAAALQTGLKINF